MGTKFNPQPKPEKRIAKAKQPINKQSPKKAAINILYIEAKKLYMFDHQKCEVEGCKSKSIDIHHKAGRIGLLLIDPNNFLAVCRKCHSEIELNPSWAKEKKYSIKRI